MKSNCMKFIVSLPAYEDTEAALARNKQEMKQDIKTEKIN